VEPLQTSLLGVGSPAVDTGARVDRIRLDDHAWVDVGRSWLHGADTLLLDLVDTVTWQQGRRWMYDRMVDDPRLTSFGARQSRPRHPALIAVGAALEARYGVELRGPGLNYYRNGRDSVAPHSDRELRELDDTIVAIVTLGARRPFLVRSKRGGPSRDLAPASGDLLVMGGRTQRDWEHAVPKVARAGPRISASWRWSTALADEPAAPDTLA
jgi:alkylated DNA repair dioxygenase AlkB